MKKAREFKDAYGEDKINQPINKITVAREKYKKKMPFLMKPATVQYKDSFCPKKSHLRSRDGFLLNAYLLTGA